MFLIKGGKSNGKEISTMRKIVYTIIGFFLFSLLLTGTSYAQCLQPIKASQLVGIGVNDIRGFYLGQISDVVFNPSSDRVSSVILSDIPGMGAEHIAIPFNSLTRTGDYLFVYNPSNDFYLHYGEAPYAHFWAEGLSYYKKDQSMLESGYRSSQLLGAMVETPNGSKVARADDIVIDTASGHVVYLVLDDVGGMSNRKVAVPFSDLSKKSENLFVLKETKNQIMAAPSFRWDDMNDLTYASQIYRYYGVQPYWE
jgi:sporulation protein YlmC with PRC-barrel domain